MLACTNCKAVLSSKNSLTNHKQRCKGRPGADANSSVTRIDFRVEEDGSGAASSQLSKSEARGADGPSGSNASRSNSKSPWDKPVHCVDPKNC